MHQALLGTGNFNKIVTLTKQTENGITTDGTYKNLAE